VDRCITSRTKHTAGLDFLDQLTPSISIRFSLASLNNMVQRFFELDQGSTTRQLSADRKRCKDHFQRTQPNKKIPSLLTIKDTI